MHKLKLSETKEKKENRPVIMCSASSDWSTESSPQSLVIDLRNSSNTSSVEYRIADGKRVVHSSSSSFHVRLENKSDSSVKCVLFVDSQFQSTIVLRCGEFDTVPLTIWKTLTVHVYMSCRRTGVCTRPLFRKRVELQRSPPLDSYESLPSFSTTIDVVRD